MTFRDSSMMLRRKCVVKLIYRVMLALLDNPIRCVDVDFFRDNVFHWRAVVWCLTDTPYKGGRFTVDVKFAENFPVQLPKVQFQTPFYHPNVCAQGKIHLEKLLRVEQQHRKEIDAERCVRWIFALILSLFDDEPDTTVAVNYLASIKYMSAKKWPLKEYSREVTQTLRRYVVNSVDYTQYLRLYEELRDLYLDPVQGIYVKTVECNNLSIWGFVLFGNPNSILYRNSFFKGTILFPKKYPQIPPKVYLANVFFHPCVKTSRSKMPSRRFSVELALFKEWTRDISVRPILESLVGLMVEPHNAIARDIIRRIVVESRIHAANYDRNGFSIPQTMDEYRSTSIVIAPPDEERMIARDRVD